MQTARRPRRWVCLAAVALAALCLGGCEPPTLYGTASTARVDGRIFLAVQVRGAGERPVFDLFVSSDAERRNWSAPRRFRGELSGAVVDSGKLAIVFTDGTVRHYEYDGGEIRPEGDARGGSDRPVLAAASDDTGLYAITRGPEGLQLLRLVDGTWNPTGPPLQPPGGIASVSLALVDGVAYVVWLHPTLGRLHAEGIRPVRAARLAAGTWSILPPPAIRATADSFAAAGGPDLLITGVARPEETFFQAPLLTGAIHTGASWAELPQRPIPAEYGFAGSWPVGLCRDGESLTGVIAAGQALYSFRADPAAERIEAPQLVAGSAAHGAVFQTILMVILFFAFLTMGLVHVLILRRMRPMGMHTGDGGPPATVDPPAVPAAPWRTLEEESPAIRVGGPAAPMERVGAFLVDNLLLTPVFVVFLWAQGASLLQMAVDAQIESRLLPAGLAFRFSFLLYATVAEVLAGQTLGKRLFNICVRDTTGGRARKGRVGVRNLLRPIDGLIIPQLPFPYLPALVSMMLSPVNQRIGDRFANTVVLRRVPVSRRRLILASSSPRRTDCMERMGLQFGVVAPDADETAPLRRDPQDVAMEIARRKCEAVGERLRDGEIVIGADTLLAYEDRIIGKPRDRDHAREILRRLAGSAHAVFTGLAVWDRATGRRILTWEETRVQMAPLTEAEIEAYVASGEADGKAGAYAIQGDGGRFVHAVEGSTSNVVGLPVERLRRVLDALEV